MKRWAVILLIGLNAIALTAAAVIVDERLRHIETAVGIDVENPDGQIYAGFQALMNAMKHIHDDMDENNETIRPLTEKNKTYTTRSEPTVD